MEGLEKKNKKLKERLKEHFRLVILNDNTLEEVSTYRLNLLNLYLLISSVLVMVGLIVGSLIFYTPLKTFIPGYGDIEANNDFLELQQSTKSLENEISALSEYIERSKNRLNGSDLGDEGKAPITSIPAPLDIDFERETNTVLPSIRKNDQKAKLGQYYLLAPINGHISKDFMPNEKHFGVDILGPKNTAVKAIMDGYVIESDWTLDSGNTIAIQHANNIVSFYKHNSSILKKAGSFVQAGEAIAIIGNSGTLSDGPHLHFELWYNGHPVNPTEFINF